MMSDGRFDSQLVSVEATLLSIESSAGRGLCPYIGGHTFQAVLYLIDTGQPFLPPQEGATAPHWDLLGGSGTGRTDIYCTKTRSVQT